VYGPKASDRMVDASSVHFDDVHGASLTCDIVVAAFSGQRHRVAQQGDRKIAILSHEVAETLKSAVFLTTYPNSQIDIHIQVLQDDGGIQAAVINAASLALQDAHIPMRDFVVCSNVAVVGDGRESHIVVDPTRRETLSGGADLFYATYAHSPEDLLTLSMQRRARDGELPALMATAAGACQALYQSIESQLREYMAQKAAIAEGMH